MDVLSSSELKRRIACSLLVALGTTGVGLKLAQRYGDSVGVGRGRPIPVATKEALEQTAEPRARAIAQSLINLTLLNPAEASVEDNADKTSAVLSAISFVKGSEFIIQADMGLSNNYPDAAKTTWASIETVDRSGIAREIQVESVPDVSGPPVWTINYLEAQPRQRLRLLANSFPTRTYGSLNSLPVQDALQENRNLSDTARQELFEALGFNAVIVQDQMVI